MATPIKKLLVCTVLLLAVFLSSCNNSDGVEIKSKTWYDYFDTVVTLYGSDTDAEFAEISEKVEERLSEYHGIFDIYGDGDIARINENAGAEPVKVSEETLDILEFSVKVYEITNGECNVAFGSVLEIWHDYRERALSGDVSVPTLAELEAAAEHTDIKNIVIDRDAGTVYLTDPKASLDLGAVAKGWAADRIREYLLDLGKANYAVSVGGNVAAAGGKSETEGWRIGVEDPNGGDHVAVIELFDGAVATSGSYQRYYEADGVRYHHIIDVETLFPENEFLSVTIICDSAAMADALSTAVFNMTFEEGDAFIEKLDGAEALWVKSTGEIFRSENFPG